jgi:hypothetical protein
VSMDHPHDLLHVTATPSNRKDNAYSAGSLRVLDRGCRAEMLERMYCRWGEARGMEVRLVDRSPGEEAGVKSVELTFHGPFA